MEAQLYHPKKKCKNYAAKTSDNKMERSQSTYLLKEGHIAFYAELNEACHEGNVDSNKIIETLGLLTKVVLKQENKANSGQTPMLHLMIFHMELKGNFSENFLDFLTMNLQSNALKVCKELFCRN